MGPGDGADRPCGVATAPARRPVTAVADREAIPGAQRATVVTAEAGAEVGGGGAKDDRHADPPGDGEVAPRIGALADAHDAAAAHGAGRVRRQRQAVDLGPQLAGQRDHAAVREPDHRPDERQLEHRPRVVVSDQPVRQAGAPRIGRPALRHAEMRPPATAHHVLDRGQDAGLDDLDHQSSGGPAWRSHSAGSSGWKRTRSPGSR